MGIKIGVLSDTHLNRVSREIMEIRDRYLADTDIILHAGDIVSPEVLDFFETDNLYAVSGNMDPLETRAFLPEKRVIQAGDYRIGLIHGWGAPAGLEDRIFKEFKAVDAIVYGHSHRPANHMKHGVLFFNPGSATGFSSKASNSLGILRIEDDMRGEIILL